MTASEVSLPHPLFSLWLNSSADEIARLVSNQEKLQAKTQQLEADLQMYKRVFSDTNAEKKHLEEENQQLKNSEKQKGSAEKHPSVRKNNYRGIPSKVSIATGRLLELQSC